MRSHSRFFLVFLIVTLALSLFQFSSTVNPQETFVFGNPQLPNWRNVTVTEYAEILVVDNDDGFVWEFSKNKDKFNQIYQNGTLIVKDEQWLLVGSDLKEDSYPIQRLEWNQTEPYHVVVTDFYEDAKKNNTFEVIYNFYGGFRPKISFNASIGTNDDYSVVWRCWLYKDYALNMTNYVKFWNEGEEAIVFDYADVYESFGNITEADVSEWFKGKRFDEKFNIGFLNIGEFTLDPNFGCETAYSTLSVIEDYIQAGKFYCSESGTAESITAYIEVSSQSHFVKCAIYDSSLDLLANGVTEEIDVSPQIGWKTFNFVGTKPALIAGYYWLDIWSEATAGSSYVYMETSGGERGYKSQTYNSYPSSLTWDTTDSREVSIYCTYTTRRNPTYSGFDAEPFNNMECRYEMGRYI